MPLPLIPIIVTAIQGLLVRKAAEVVVTEFAKGAVMQTKPFWQSKTMQGLFVMALAAAFPMLGLSDAEWVEVAGHAVQAVGLLWAGYGRMTAKTKIGK